MTKAAKQRPSVSRPVPNRWRLDLVDGRSTGSLYEFVRRALADHEGHCTRARLLDAILADPHAAERLKRSQGFTALLQNMKRSGFVELEGDLVRATRRRVGRQYR